MIFFPTPLTLLLRKGKDKGNNGGPFEAPSEGGTFPLGQVPDLPGEHLACVTCAFPITASQFKHYHGGDHQFTFANPHAHIFMIMLFSYAPGVALTGSATFENTWFQGFSWKYSLCGRCGLHLGWHFDSKKGEKFFGLISDRLVQRTSKSA